MVDGGVNMNPAAVGVDPVGMIQVVHRSRSLRGATLRLLIPSAPVKRRDDLRRQL
jgi:hypothetical protein